MNNVHGIKRGIVLLCLDFDNGRCTRIRRYRRPAQNTVPMSIDEAELPTELRIQDVDDAVLEHYRITGEVR